MGFVLDYNAGNYLRNPAEAELSESARALISSSFEDIEEGKFIDHHMHVLGLGTDNSGIWLSDDLFSLLHPSDSLKTKAYTQLKSWEGH